MKLPVKKQTPTQWMSIKVMYKISFLPLLLWQVFLNLGYFSYYVHREETQETPSWVHGNSSDKMHPIC